MRVSRLGLHRGWMSAVAMATAQAMTSGKRWRSFPSAPRPTPPTPTRTALLPPRWRLGRCGCCGATVSCRSTRRWWRPTVCWPRGHRRAPSVCRLGRRRRVPRWRPDGRFEPCGFRLAGGVAGADVVGATATYHDVVAGGDLVVTATTTGFELSVVLRKAPSAPPVFSLPLNLAGLSLSQEVTGRLNLTALRTVRPWPALRRRSCSPRLSTPVRGCRRRPRSWPARRARPGRRGVGVASRIFVFDRPGHGVPRDHRPGVEPDR